MSDTYAAKLGSLLPRGPYDLGDGTVNAADLAAFAAALEVAESQITDLFAELFADGADALITDWERVYGLASNPGEPVSVRRQALLSKIRRPSGISIAVIQDGLLPFLGYKPAITEYVLVAGDPPEYIYRFTVTVVSAQVTVPFRPAAIRQAIEELKPAHTQGVLVYDGGFLTDDPNSLTDTETDVLAQ